MKNNSRKRMTKKIEKKKFKDTKLGAWLKNKAPDILEKVADKLPDAGYLSIVKTGINLLNPKDKEEGLKEVEKVEKKLTQIDIDNNRILLEDLQRASSTYEKDSELQKKIATNLMWSYIIQSTVVIIGLCMMSYFDIKLSDFVLVLITTIVNNTGQRYGSVIDFFFGGSLGGVKDNIKKIIPPKK